MKALILVGGYGTRLRPLTFSCPKPLVEFGNKPILAHQVEALVRVGVKEIILAINYHPNTMREYIHKLEQEETEPLGTAGPLRLAKDLIVADNPEQMFFVFNSDIICEFPLQQMIEFHKTHKGEGTIFVTEVEDPTRFGVVVSDEKGQIKQFVEKPQQFISNKINAGLYLFNTSIIDKIPLKPTSIEREIFPTIAANEQLYSLLLPGFWKDVGEPKDFLLGTQLLLESYRNNKPQILAEGVVGNVLVDESAVVEEGAVLGPNVVIGPGCVVRRGAKLQNSVVLQNTVIGEYSWISDTILGWNSTVGKWVRIEGVTVSGENVWFKDELFINSTIILPHRQVTGSIYSKGTIIM